MKKYKAILLLSIVLLGLSSHAQASQNGSSIIPYPKHIQDLGNKFVFTANTKWYVENDAQKQVVEQFGRLFAKSAGFVPVLVSNKTQASVIFITDDTIEKEGYKIIVNDKGLTVNASSKEGFFYALQSVRQLLPAELESSTTAKNADWSIPYIIIEDAPRFAYRGLMLDASRFFIPKDEVLRIIDCMGALKINKLHFHLVDDNGWRLEIKKYPKLTEVGAWRVDRKEHFPARKNPKKGEPTPVGGFYTQDDIREIVGYASERMVEVIPEIEMPAHTISSLSAYPQLACPVVDEFIGVLPGIGGPHARMIYCAGNDDVFTFIENVMDEVIQLFPSQYIHLGGDEADKFYWEKCPKCKVRMLAEGLDEVEELQGYFMNRVSKYVQRKGKQVMGWDELTNSKLPDGAIIYGWQGQGQAALKAARQGHQFIMTPAQILYLIRYQGPQWFEPYTYFGNNTLADVYNYEPIQDTWEPEVEKLLMGVQASLWTEFCTSVNDVEYQLFPRLLALSEIAWTGKTNKSWDSFLLRTDAFLNRLDQKGIIYAKSMFNLDHKVLPQDGDLSVELSCIRPDVEIRYTLDGSVPNMQSELYVSPISVTKTSLVQATTFQYGKQAGEVLKLDLEFNLATGKKVESGVANDYLLTNGLRGSDRHSDFEWMGWHNKDASFTVDLGQVTDVKEVQLGNITNYSMGVHKPKMIKLSISTDGVNYRQVKQVKFAEKVIFKEKIGVEDIHFGKLKVSGRYLKVEFENPGVCPIGNVREGMANWVYFDEIIIK